MFIIEKPYASELIFDTILQNDWWVLDNQAVRDAEIEGQVYVVLHDVFNEGIEYLKEEDNRDAIICAAVPALESILKDREKGLENKIKSKDFKDKPKVFKAIYKAYEYMKKITPKLYDILKKAKKDMNLKKNIWKTK